MIITGIILMSSFIVFLFSWKALGIVIIADSEVGIITKKISRKKLPAGRIIATQGEAGIQAATLNPGWHFWYWPFVYSVKKVELTTILPGQIGLIMSVDGKPTPSSQILAKSFDSDYYQAGDRFLNEGGQKGKQATVLTAGKYRINTSLFKIEIANVTVIPANAVGIVTTYDGKPLESGEIAGKSISGHDNFQSIGAFLASGGCRGLQEQTILAGQWNLNPWFVSVKAVPMTVVPIGYVGVVTSYVGDVHTDISGEEFTHGHLVEQGHKGVWAVPLYPGMHPVNTDTMKVDLVPTTNVVLNWAEERSEAHKLDENLSSITVRSNDGFSYNMDVSVVIHIASTDAARVISRMGSMSGLISQVLEPTIGNYFRNSAQGLAALDFLKSRTSMQQQASKFVRAALTQYDVEAVDTLIGDMALPPQLLETQTQRKLAEEMKQTYEVQQDAQKQKEALSRQTAITEMQAEVVKSEQQVKIAEQQATAKIKSAEGDSQQIKLLADGDAERIAKVAKAEAEGIKAKGLAQAEAYKSAASALGESNYTVLETMSIISREKMKVIPDILVGSSASGENSPIGILTALLAENLSDRVKKKA